MWKWSIEGFCRLKCKGLYMLLYYITDLKTEMINTLVILAGNSKLALQKNGGKPESLQKTYQVNEQMDIWGWSNIRNVNFVFPVVLSR